MFFFRFFAIRLTPKSIEMDIATKVKELIVEKLCVEEKDVVPEASFTNDLGADSLDTVELIMDLEKEFQVTIPEEMSEDIKTVGDVIKFIEDQKAKE